MICATAHAFESLRPPGLQSRFVVRSERWPARSMAAEISNGESALTVALEHHLNYKSSGRCNVRKIIASVVVALFCAAGIPSYAQFGAVKDGAKKVGEATVDTTKKGVE